ncbi:MAG: hypothetical protein ACLSA0_05200 [Eisenbergiella massiliensis]
MDETIHKEGEKNMEGLLHIFPKILNMTLSASCAGVVVLLLRALLKKSACGVFLCALDLGVCKIFVSL